MIYTQHHQCAEALTQREQDTRENAPGGTALRAYRHEIDCPRCREGSLFLLGAGYVCLRCKQTYHAINNRPIL